MLILEDKYIVIDVDYQMGEEFPNKDWKRMFPFYLNITAQINGGTKRVRTCFNVYYYEDNSLKEFEKFDLSTVHTVVDIFRSLWYEIDYPKIVSQIGDFTNYTMWQIKKYLNK